MSTIIQIKRGTGSAVPSGLADGELAINLDNGKLFFGSGSNSINSFRFKNLTAENYIVSSSVTNITTQTLSGSSAFGDSIDDTHQFTGAITASGNISASGNLLGGGITVNGNSIFNSNVITLGVDDSDRINLNAYVATNVDIRGPITASGNISSSGIATANSFTGNGLSIDGPSNAHIEVGEYNVGFDVVALNTIFITGSGLIISGAMADANHHNMLKIGNVELLDLNTALSPNEFLIHNVNSFKITSGSDGGDAGNSGRLFEHNGTDFTLFKNNAAAIEVTNATTTLTNTNVQFVGSTFIKADIESPGANGYFLFAASDPHLSPTITKAVKTDNVFQSLTGNVTASAISASGTITALALDINGVAANTIDISSGEGNVAINASSTDADCMIRVQDNSTAGTNAMGIVATSDDFIIRNDEGNFKVKMANNATTTLTLNQSGDLSLTGEITASAVSASGTITAAAAVLTTADINGGTIDGITSLTAGGNLDIGAHDLRAATLTADGLTSGRVVFAGTAGVLSDDADLTFATDTLTVTKIANVNSISHITASGNISASGHISSSGLYIQSSTIADFIKLNSLGSNANPIKLIFEKAASEQGIIEYNRNGDLEIYNTDSDGGVMIDGSTSAGGDLYVANSGNVGIGTTTPPEKLTVEGNISSSGNIITEGHITASGNISASGTINVHNIQSNGHNVANFDGDSINFGYENFTAIQIGKSGNPTTFYGNITASGVLGGGNISASGDTHVFGNVTMNSGKTFIGNATDESASENLLVVGGVSGASIKLYSSHVGTNRDVGLHMSASENGQEYSIGLARARNTFYISPSDVSSGPENAVFEIDAVGNITASGNISSSGDIKANTFTAVGNVDFDGDLDVEGTANLDIVDIDGAVDMASTLTVDGIVDIAGELQHSGDADTKISFNTNQIAIKAGNTSVFESTITGSKLTNVHQNIYNTGSLALSGNGGAIGDIVKFGGITTIAGGLYALTGSDWSLASATSTATGATSSLAVALGTNPASDGMCLRGFVNPTVDPSAPLGNPIFLNTTVGRMVKTAPASSNNVVRILGYQYGTDLIYFNPSNDYIIHA